MRIRSLVLLPLLFTTAVIAGESSNNKAQNSSTNVNAPFKVAVISYSQETCTFSIIGGRPSQ